MVNFTGAPVKLTLSATGVSESISTRAGKHGFQILKVDGGTPGAFSVTIQGSFDDQNWATIGSAVTASGLPQIEGVYPFLRVNVTTLASGDSLSVIYVGVWH